MFYLYQNIIFILLFKIILADIIRSKLINNIFKINFFNVLEKIKMRLNMFIGVHSFPFFLKLYIMALCVTVFSSLGNF